MLPRHLYATLAALSVLARGDSVPATMEGRSAQEIINQLKLMPNTEKGYYAQTFEDPATINNRSVSTLIYYLLEGSAGRSEWHRLDAAEVWHFYAGAPLNLSLSLDDGAPVVERVLGPDIFNSQTPQVVIPRKTWQSAQSLGLWTLVGTTGETRTSLFQLE